MTVRTPVEPRDPEDWARIERSPAFVGLVRAKARFVVPATVFFVAYFFALPILVGYAPQVMERDVVGHVTFAYAFALSEFVMTGVVAALYVRSARGFDASAARIVEDARRASGAVREDLS